MANTSDLKEIKKYVVEKLSKEMGIQLVPKKILLGVTAEGEERFKDYDGVSQDGSLIVFISNSGGKTTGGNLPNGKLNTLYRICWFLNLTKANRKILILTNKELFDIFKKDSDGFLSGIEIRYFKLPEHLEDAAEEVRKKASDEMK